jgi:uracil-DNA glycosylase
MKWDIILQTWYPFFNKFLLNDKYINKLVEFLNEQYILNNIYPLKKDIFNCFKFTKYNDLQVVILSDEPYIDGSSNGVAFGINEDIGKDINSSLIQMQETIERDVKDGLYFMDLSCERWTKQGVLMLNSALTVIKNNKYSHGIYWRYFTKYLLLNLSKEKTGIIYCLWGKQAQSYKKYINADNNYILEFEHPSDASKKGVDWNCTHFNDINKIIEDNNGKSECIIW